MKETYATSSGPRTCGVESPVTGRTKIRKIESVATKETMTCTVHITINPLGTACLQGVGTRGKSGLFHVTCGR
jgi:hypothetical protein